MAVYIGEVFQKRLAIPGRMRLVCENCSTHTVTRASLSMVALLQCYRTYWQSCSVMLGGGIVFEFRPNNGMLWLVIIALFSFSSSTCLEIYLQTDHVHNHLLSVPFSAVTTVHTSSAYSLPRNLYQTSGCCCFVRIFRSKEFSITTGVRSTTHFIVKCMQGNPIARNS